VTGPGVRIFVYEHLCGGGLAGSAGAASLQAEGWAMLSAVAADFAAIAEVQTLTLLDASLEGTLPGTVCRRARAGEWEGAFVELASGADFTLVIAPEVDGVLAALCGRVEEVSGRLLGPSAAAVRLTADKAALGRHFVRHGVATPACLLVTERTTVPSELFPAVLKPRDGAGSQATFLVPTAGALPSCLEQARAERPAAEWLVQQYAPGQPASVAFLIGPATLLPLLPATQEMSAEGRLHYRGGALPLRAALADRAVRLGHRAVRSVPDLRGYVGVDLVLGAAPDGSADRVLEINPRLTTSYVGLRRLARTNLARALLQCVRGEAVELPRWRTGRVRYRPEGEVEDVR
jgi:predicted ATP-grasp superfamily ATP-dependent carboligase